MSRRYFGGPSDPPPPEDVHGTHPPVGSPPAAHPRARRRRVRRDGVGLRGARAAPRLRRPATCDGRRPVVGRPRRRPGRRDPHPDLGARRGLRGRVAGPRGGRRAQCAGRRCRRDRPADAPAHRGPRVHDRVGARARGRAPRHPRLRRARGARRADGRLAGDAVRERHAVGLPAQGRWSQLHLRPGAAPRAQPGQRAVGPTAARLVGAPRRDRVVELRPHRRVHGPRAPPVRDADRPRDDGRAGRGTRGPHRGPPAAVHGDAAPAAAARRVRPARAHGRPLRRAGLGLPGAARPARAPARPPRAAGHPHLGLLGRALRRGVPGLPDVQGALARLRVPAARHRRRGHRPHSLAVGQGPAVAHPPPPRVGRGRAARDGPGHRHRPLRVPARAASRDRRPLRHHQRLPRPGPARGRPGSRRVRQPRARRGDAGRSPDPRVAPQRVPPAGARTEVRAERQGHPRVPPARRHGHEEHGGQLRVLRPRLHRRHLRRQLGARARHDRARLRLAAAAHRRHRPVAPRPALRPHDPPQRRILVMPTWRDWLRNRDDVMHERVLRPLGRAAALTGVLGVPRGQRPRGGPLPARQPPGARRPVRPHPRQRRAPRRHRDPGPPAALDGGRHRLHERGHRLLVPGPPGLLLPVRPHPLPRPAPVALRPRRGAAGRDRRRPAPS